MGHDSEEVDVDIDGNGMVDKSLQQAINDGDLGGSFGDLTTTGTLVSGALESFTLNHVYVAQTDGFLMVYTETGALNEVTYIRSDTSNPPITVVIAGHAGYSNNILTAPIKQGNFFQVANSIGSATINWIPIG